MKRPETSLRAQASQPQRGRYALSAFCVLLAHVAACGTANPEPPAVPDPPSVVAYRPPPPCTTAEDCLEKGTEALKEDRAGARDMLVLACKKGSVTGCFELGKACATAKGGPEDQFTARSAFNRICQEPNVGSMRYQCRAAPLTESLLLGTCIVDACAWLAELARDDDSDRLTFAERGCSIEGKDGEDDRALRARACFAAAKGQEKKDQAAAARDSYERACSLGNADACTIALKTPAKTAQVAAETGDAKAGTLSMSRLNAGGLIMRDVSCSTTDNPVFAILGGATVGAGFSTQKAALSKCSPRPYESKIRWAADGHVVTELTAEGPDPKISACVEAALRGVLSVPNMRCSATLVIGDVPEH